MSEAKRKKPVNGNQQYTDSELELMTQVVTRNYEKGYMDNYSDGMQIGILPPKLWDQIFKKVHSPRDLLNCWKTTSAWSTALRSTDFYFKMTLEFVLPYLNQKDVLQCCLVSKSWNATVDACTGTLEDFKILSKLSGGKKIQLILESRNIPDFITKFQLSNVNESREKIKAANPAIFRLVRLSLQLDPPSDLMGPEEFADNRAPNPFTFDYNNVITCLDNYGHLIRYLELTVSGEIVPFHVKLKLIQNCLERTPNLISLGIKVPTSPSNIRDQRLVCFYLAVFSGFRSVNPWPPLEHLKVLKFYDTNNRRELASIALAYSPQIISLKFGLPMVIPNWVPSNGFSRLQRISFQCSNLCDAKEFGAIVRSGQCPLQNLRIWFQDDPDEENCNELAKAINVAGATLSVLNIHSQAGVIRVFKSDITKFHQLRLPRLKQFGLYQFGYPTLRFLQSVCPAIQRLTVIACPVRLAQYHSRMYEKLYSKHEFWNILAHIQSVDLKCIAHFEDCYCGIDVKHRHRKRIPGKFLKQYYTRREYEAKLAIEHSLGQKINNNWTESSSSEDECEPVEGHNSNMMYRHFYDH